MKGACQHCGAQLALGAVACFRCGRMLDGEAGGTTGGGQLPTELQTLAKAGLLEGRWRLVRPIGQGHSGVVWEAHDVTFDRRVAVKLMHAALCAIPAQVTRFEREARVLASMDHLNLTPVLGSGRFQRRPFVVMRLLEGRTVAELMHARGGKLSIADASFCILPLCDALQALHEVSVVHRDLKPSNVFISQDGRVTLLDLGQAFESGSELTRTRELQGTAEYLSPEQIAGHGVDARSDVYALGCLLYELFTGHPPFVGDLAHVLAAHATAPRPATSSLGAASEVRSIGALVVKMMSVAPAARPALAEVKSTLQPYAPASLELPALPRSERERLRTTHSSTLQLRDEGETRPVAVDMLAEEPTALRDAVTARGTRPEDREGPAGPLSPLAPPSASSPLEAEPTAVGIAARPRESVTKAVERRLSGSAKAVLALAAVALVGFVLLGLAQSPPTLPVPVRVDQPKVEMPVAKVEPPPVAPPPGPPPEARTEAPAPPMPALEEKKTWANAAAPMAAPPKRGRPPNRAAVGRGYLRIVTSLAGDEIKCRLWIDGKYAGHTPYWSGILRPGDHVLKAECPEWPPEVVIWPIPPIPLQKQGELVEIMIGVPPLADQPIQGITERTGYFMPCPKGAPQCKK